MNKTATAVALAAMLAAGGLGLWWWQSRSDDFDYEAAFEQLPETDGAAAAVQLSTFAGKPRAQAEGALGRPQQCESSLYSERCRYGGGIEIVYIDGKADWITVPLGYGRHPLAPETLAQLGLAPSPPQDTQPQRLRWTALPGLRLVELVGDDNGAIYARIKVSHV